MVTFAGNEFLSFYTDYVGGTNRFIVIGVQQWGYNSVLNTPTALTFPVSFTSSVYALTIGNVGEAVYNGNTCVYDITSNGCIIAFNARAYWVDIGIQQWGHKDNSTSIVTFNLSFPTTCFIALVETLNDGTVNSHLRVSGATNVGFSTWDSATNRPYSVQNYWLALGI